MRQWTWREDLWEKLERLYMGTFNDVKTFYEVMMSRLTWRSGWRICTQQSTQSSKYIDRSQKIRINERHMNSGFV